MTWHWQVSSAVPAGVLLGGLLLSALFLRLGVWLAGVKGGFLRAVLAVVVIYPTGFFLALLGGLLGGPILALLLGFGGVLAVLKVFFAATWPQALVIWVVLTLGQALLLGGALALTGWGLTELWRRLGPMMPGGSYMVHLALPWGRG